MKRIALFLFFISSQAWAVTFEEQAQRLQNVSAALLDAVPAYVPSVWKPYSPLRLEGAVGAQFALLPKVNPTVGAKTEKVPSSPIHMVPSVSLGLSPGVSWPWLGGTVYAGLLPPGGERLLGVKASLFQWLVGIQPHLFLLNEREYFLAVSPLFHLTSATMKGRIASHASRHDSFESQTLLYGTQVSGGWRKIWVSALVAKKQTKSTFFIADDLTTLNQNDSLSDTSLGLVTQVAVGVKIMQSVTLGLAETYTPQRLLLPKLVLSVRVWESGQGAAGQMQSSNVPEPKVKVVPQEIEAGSSLPKVRKKHEKNRTRTEPPHL